MYYNISERVEGIRFIWYLYLIINRYIVVMYKVLLLLVVM